MAEEPTPEQEAEEAEKATPTWDAEHEPAMVTKVLTLVKRGNLRKLQQLQAGGQTLDLQHSDDLPALQFGMEVISRKCVRLSLVCPVFHAEFD